MRINQVVKQTGMSKRTIYYYIEEQLIFPEINSSNGYYVFSEDDVSTLNMLQQLRKMNFSIKDIRALLSHPQSIHVLLQKQIDRLNREQQRLREQIERIRELEDTLPPASIDAECLKEALSTLSVNSVRPPSYFSDTAGDAKLVCLYLWGTFLQGVPMTEYRQYLWEKILSAAAHSADSDIAVLKQFLYSLPPEQIDSEFAGRNLHVETIISLTAKTLPRFVAAAIEQIRTFLTDDAFVAEWRMNYHSRILPTTSLFDSDLNKLVRELSPRFSTYYRNIHLCCGKIYRWLHSDDGQELKKQLLTKLHGYLDLETNHHGILAALFSYRDFD